MPKILTIFGTRPEAIKMAPLVTALKRQPEYETVVAVSAQHREMLDQVLGLFHISPDYDLDIMRHGQSLTQVTSRVLNGLEEVIVKEQPDMILVHGDTTTTFVAALAGYYQQTAVGHVEAGLRTGNKYSPYPEEMNRRLAGALTDLHFAPTDEARDNLLAEGTAPDKIFVTGNTVIDALLTTVDKRFQFADPVLEELTASGKKFLLLTAHRRENWGKPMARIFRAVKRLADNHPEMAVVFPVHKNPRVRQLAHEILGGHAGVVLIEPLDYQPFANLMDRSQLVLTDSGGMQEEAPSLGKPVLVLRDTTERPEAVVAGTVRLVGTDEEKIFRQAEKVLTDPDEYAQMAQATNPYGDGQACKRIIQCLDYYFGLRSEQPMEFNYSGEIGKY
ncbi:UDP-N-acetylglucosamine 2-epimerase (non-hydrolyzing) [Metallumcola ferriviriculae]|uniref:UDP-N-acetylglucosamine 2-epimerase (non-hydrolyzing) n=1 Tax=Metallumcola ferriviriculae TaxID=3039180 RepID=A0AAU0UKT1_9FIRM|nr:UDP-N-acetylglucosamine 2-epimerase (non-hydrolyzing) [Desulfitibacteraceae bacterium MK1]